MKKNLIIWQVVGLTFTAVLGTLLHFVYDWTNLTFFATISSVNESTWEHMKLIFVPSFIFAIIQSFYADDCPCFWPIKLIGILSGTLLIPVLFYTLSGAFGELSAIINIAIFFIAVICEYLLETFLFNRLTYKTSMKLPSVLILSAILLAFFAFTFYPPKIPLFLDPVTNTYGLII